VVVVVAYVDRQRRPHLGAYGGVVAVGKVRSRIADDLLKGGLMQLLGCTFGPEGDRYRYIPGYLLNLLLCPFGIHGTGCRGRRDHSPLTGRWHNRF
jgi:hypothetical protein